MKIKLTSVYVDDQENALRFYTDVLGFVTKADVKQNGYRWLTVASAEEPDGTELQLALNDDPAAKTFQQARAEIGNKVGEQKRQVELLKYLDQLRHATGLPRSPARISSSTRVDERADVNVS